MKNEDWFKFQEYIAKELSVIDPYARSTKGSGNKGEKGDIKLNNARLNIECKAYNKVNVYQEQWLKKCISEIPFNSDKIGILVTKNKTNDIRVHMDWLDFLNLYIEYHKLKYGVKNA